MHVQKLVALLDLPDDDYWYDLACGEARDIIDLHYEEVLSTAIAQWRSWSPLRQEHLAYILGEGDSSIEAELVGDMTNSEYADVRSCAMDALRCLMRAEKPT